MIPYGKMKNLYAFGLLVRFRFRVTAIIIVIEKYKYAYIRTYYKIEPKAL